MMPTTLRFQSKQCQRTTRSYALTLNTGQVWQCIAAFNIKNVKLVQASEELGAIEHKYRLPSGVLCESKAK